MVPRNLRWTETPSARTWLVVTIILFAAAWLVLLAYMLYVAFPTMAETGDAQLQAWLGPQAARIAYLLLGGLMSAAYIWVAVQGTRERGDHLTFPWRAGAVVGGSAGLILAVSGVLWNVLALLPYPFRLNATATSIGGFFLGLLLAVAAPLSVGLIVGQATSRIESAALGGFWCGVALALIAATGGAALDLALANWLTHSVWVGAQFAGPGCSANPTGAVLAGCVVGDDLGGWGVQLLALPLIGAGLGALAGVLARRQTASAVQPEAEGAPSLRAATVFSMVMLVVLVLELAFKLW